MAKFLMAVWPLAGHYHPNLAIALALRKRGHEVCFYTGPGAEATIKSEGFPCYTFHNVDNKRFEALLYTPSKVAPRWRQLLDQRDRYQAWLVGTLRDQIRDVAAVLSAWKPDVLVCDPLMWGPYLVLRESHHLTIAIFAYVPFCSVPSAEVPPVGLGLPPVRDWRTRMEAALGRMVIRISTAGIRRSANEIRKEHGLAPLRMTVSELSGRMPLHLVAGTPEFDLNRRDVPASVRYVGPCLWSKSNPEPPPAWLREMPADKPVIHVTEGTVHVKEPLVLRAAARGLADRNANVVMATGSHRQPSEMGLEPLAPNIRVERWVRYDHLLPRTDLVVTTGGSGTVLSALAAGIPLVVIPTEWDKPEVARRVAEAGAGVLLPPQQCTAERLRSAVERVLGEPSFRANARRLASSFARYGGPDKAAELLEALGSQNQTAPRMATV